MTKKNPAPPFTAVIIHQGMKDNLIGKNSKDFVGYKIMDYHGAEITRVKTVDQKNKALAALKAKHGTRRK